MHLVERIVRAEHMRALHTYHPWHSPGMAWLLTNPESTASDTNRAELYRRETRWLNQVEAGAEERRRQRMRANGYTDWDIGFFAKLGCLDLLPERPPREDDEDDAA